MKRSFLLTCVILFLDRGLILAQDNFEKLRRSSDNLFQTEKYEEAILEYDKAIKAAGKNNKSLFLCYLNRGIAKSRTGDYWSAKTDIDHSIKLNSEYPDSYLLRGVLSVLIKNENSALNDFNRAAELDTLNYFAHLYKADIYEDYKDFDKALESYEDALKINPNITEVFKKRAAIYFSLKKYSEAVEDYSRLIEQDPLSGELYFMRGLCKSLISDVDEFGACDDFRQAKNLGAKTNLPGINKYCKVKDLEN